MATQKKKKQTDENVNPNGQQGFDPNNPTEADVNQMRSEQMQYQEDAQALAQIKAIDDKARMLKQESLNKEHDDELKSNSSFAIDAIGAEQIANAYELLNEYKADKSETEEKLVRNEKIWKMLHWEVQMDSKLNSDNERIQPKSSWLVNTILNKHADAMDNFPDANILPRSADDEQTAKQLSEIVPVILDQNDFEAVYSDVQWYKQKNGVGCYGVFWNNDKQNGLGDIDIKKIDMTQLYWKSGISDLEDSPNVFLVTMMDNEEIKARYPDVMDEAANGSANQNFNFNYGEKVDTNDTSAVIDWYYKRRVQTQTEDGIPKVETKLHYCKFCNGKVIYASENDPTFAESGWYDHAKYPFIVDKLFPVEKNIVGMGYIDLIADDQMYIDKLSQAILENAMANSRPKYLVKSDGDINEEELLDNSKAVVHTEANLDEKSFKQIQVNPLSSIYESVYLQRIQEMKDTSGNTATSQGQTSSVTTASGIASLMEASGKLSRDSTSESYRSYKRLVYLVIELIRQFYTEPRCFRIIGDKGENQFVEFDNRGLAPASQGQVPDGEGGVIDLGSRVPIMDIEVKCQKKSAYSKETQNQTALQLYSQGFFAPANADASLACLSMMDFDGVEKMREMVERNGTLYTMLLQAQQQIAQLTAIVAAQNPQYANDLLAGSGDQMAQMAQSAAQTSGNSKSVGSTSKGSLPSQAANNTRESTAPRT